MVSYIIKKLKKKMNLPSVGVFYNLRRLLIRKIESRRGNVVTITLYTAYTLLLTQFAYLLFYLHCKYV